MVIKSGSNWSVRQTEWKTKHLIGPQPYIQSLHMEILLSFLNIYINLLLAILHKLNLYFILAHSTTI